MTAPFGNVTLCKQIVSDYMRVPLTGIEGPRRAWAWPRQIAMALASECCPSMTQTMIARAFNRDLATVRHALAKVARAREEDQMFDAMFRTMAGIYTSGAGKPLVETFDAVGRILDPAGRPPPP